MDTGSGRDMTVRGRVTVSGPCLERLFSVFHVCRQSVFFRIMASLLDEDGAISDKFEKTLKEIFAKYCTPRPESLSLVDLPPNACLDAAGLDKWASDTNGEPFSQESKDEILEFMDLTDEGNLTCEMCCFVLGIWT